MHYLVTRHEPDQEMTQESLGYIQFAYRNLHKQKAQRFRVLSPPPIQIEAHPNSARNYTNIKVYSLDQGGSKERLRKKIQESQKRRIFKANWARLNPD